MPFTAETRLDRGNLLSLVGRQHMLSGRRRSWGTQTGNGLHRYDLRLPGHLFGGLVGLLTVTIGGLPSPHGQRRLPLVMGLWFGYLGLCADFRPYPEPAMWVFDMVA